MKSKMLHRLEYCEERGSKQKYSKMQRSKYWGCYAVELGKMLQFMNEMVENQQRSYLNIITKI